MEESNKLKISSDFVFPKLIFIIVLISDLLILSDYHRTEKGFPTNPTIGCVVLLTILYYLFSRPTVYYNERKMFIKKNKDYEIEIPLENIESIKLSIIGFSKNGGSWLVKYYSENSKLTSIRIYPSILSNSFSGFINSAKSKNPKIKVRNWTAGINELFD